MAWIERIVQRARRGRLYADDASPSRYMSVSTLATINCESVLGSGVYDTAIDFTLQRVDTAALDGWLVTVGDWRYALGQPGDKATDGWVGFGGRQGAHWLKFRLLRVGYLHWPTRAWQDVGGVPTYDRANLSREVHSITVGPNDDQVNVAAEAMWDDIWTTPGGGALSMTWKLDGGRLKEEVTINQAGRNWIKNNRPPTTAVAETWFGFVFQMDWSDVPEVTRAGLAQSLDDDFADDGETIVLHDVLGNVLGALPLDYVRVASAGKSAWTEMRKRFWKDGDDHYLLVGVRCDVLNAMPDGDLVFDPTVTPSVAADNDEAVTYPTGQLSMPPNGLYFGDDGDWNHSLMRFTLNVPAGASITTAYLTFVAWNTASGTIVRTKVHYEDADDPGDFTGATYASVEARVRSSTAFDWDGMSTWTDGNTYNSGAITAVIQALVDEAYWAANDHCIIIIEDDGSDDGAHRIGESHYSSSSQAAILTVEYEEPVTIAPKAMDHYRRRRA